MTAQSVNNSDGEITVSHKGPITLIGINRPAKLNGFSGKMATELGEAFENFENDANARVAVVWAHGKHFTAGVQLDQIGKWFAEGKHFAPEGIADPFDLFAPLRNKPVVASVQGICFTIGIELMLAADIVVAADDANFGQIEVSRGIFANHGGIIRILERAGWGNTMRYLLTGDFFDAAEAYRLGLVQEVVPVGQQMDRAMELAEKIAAQAPLAVAETRRIARKAQRDGWLAAIDDFGPKQADIMKTEDAAEGLKSFAEKRDGVFKGR